MIKYNGGGGERVGRKGERGSIMHNYRKSVIFVRNGSEAPPPQTDGLGSKPLIGNDYD